MKWCRRCQSEAMFQQLVAALWMAKLQTSFFFNCQGTSVKNADDASWKYKVNKDCFHIYQAAWYSIECLVWEKAFSRFQRNQIWLVQWKLCVHTYLLLLVLVHRFGPLTSIDWTNRLWTKRLDWYCVKLSIQECYQTNFSTVCLLCEL